MYPPKLKTRSRAVDTPNPYLTQERKEKLLVMKRQLESQDAKLKIKQLYANARAATLRAVARAARPTGSTPAAPLGIRASESKSSSTKPFLSANEAARKGLSVEATLARILAVEKTESSLRKQRQKIFQQIDCSESPEKTVHGSLKKMDTTQLVQEYKDIDWANISEYQAHEFEAALKKEQDILRQKQRATLEELNKQVEEHHAAAKQRRNEEEAYSRSIYLSVDQWRESERRKASDAQAKVLRDKEEMEQTLLLRAKQREEEKKQKDKEDRKLIRQTLREIERQKQKDLREKLEYREAVRRITAVSQQEQQKAQMREEEEKKEDLRFLKESLLLEKESEARRLAERQRHVEAHQSRAERIAPTMRVEKAEAATRSAIARYTKEQAELEKKELEQRQRKKQAAKDNTEYLKRQVQERQDRKKAETEERRKIQQEQEEDAKAYKIETEAKERNKRLENMKQQNLLLQQIEEHKRRTDMSVSPTEIKLNRALLEQVKEFRRNQLSRALPRRCQKDDSDSDDN